MVTPRFNLMHEGDESEGGGTPAHRSFFSRALGISFHYLPAFAVIGKTLSSLFFGSLLNCSGCFVLFCFSVEAYKFFSFTLELRIIRQSVNGFSVCLFVFLLGTR